MGHDRPADRARLLPDVVGRAGRAALPCRRAANGRQPLTGAFSARLLTVAGVETPSFFARTTRVRAA